ncbi:hypothetical protein B0G57_11717 [Trinickia symbiotica]|nr:hypothetical protein B0G57_11717 [Trinickia symbiotica]
MSGTVTHWESGYALPVEDIPWEIGTPPQELLDLLSDADCPQCGRALDVACGTGNYSRYLASRGFDVIGVTSRREH